MNKKGKISLFVFLLLVAFVVLLHVQARRVILALVESQADERVEANIGTLQLLPFKQSILLKDVSVSIQANDSTGFRRSSVSRVYLEIGSLWDFLFGGTLVIEKMACEGGELVMARKPVDQNDTTAHVAFDLSAIFERLKKNAIRFNIQDMSFLDFNLTLLNDSTHAPTLIRHVEFRARDLYLSADSILKRKPYIEFGLPAQQIELRNGPTTLKFDTLFFSTIDNSIQINELEVLTSDQESGSDYRISSDKVRVAYFDFESLYTSGVAKVDTVFLGRSRLEAKVNVRKKSTPGNRKDAEYHSLPYILVRNLVVSQLAADVKLHREDIENSFAIHNSFVTVQQLIHNPDSSQRFSLTNFDVLISDYETFLNNKNTSITFDTIRLHNHGLALLNFDLRRANQSRPILHAPVFELKEIDWYTLLFLKRLVAEEAIALNPIVNTTLLPPKGDGGASQELAVLESLQEFLDVDLFSLRNASANLNFDAGRTTISLRGINASILTNKMIQSRSFDEVLEATPVFSFRYLVMKREAIDAHIENFDLRRGRFTLGNVVFADGDRIGIKANALNIDQLFYNQALRTISVSGFGWQSAEVSIMGGTVGREPEEKTVPTISLSMVRGGNTDVRYSAQELEMNAHFDKINLNSLQLGDVITMDAVDIGGRNAGFRNDSTGLSVKTFSFADIGSELENIRWYRYGIDTLESSIGRISFNTDFNLLAQQQVSIPILNVVGMKTAYSKRDSAHRLQVTGKTDIFVKAVRYNKQNLTIGSLDQTIDSIYFLNEKRVANKIEVRPNTPINERWKIRDEVDSLMAPTNRLGVAFQQRIGSPTQTNGKLAESRFSTQLTRVESEREGIVLSMSNIETFSHDSSTHVKANLDSMRFSGIRIHHNEIDAQLEYGVLESLIINTSWFKEPMAILRANHPTMAAHDFNVRIVTPDHLLKFDQFDYDPLQSEGFIKGLEHRPRKDKKSFLDESFFQTNYMHTKIESLSFKHWNADRFVNDSTIHVQAIRVGAPRLEIDRDKTHPFYSSKIKLLPTNAFQKLGMRFKVDSLQFQDGKIVYTEKSKVTGKEGSIHFTNVEGLVRNIKNIELEKDDTLFIRAGARFLDSANVDLRVRESYQDTLAGFLMTTQVSPFHTSILNPILVPLVSVKFESGFIDTLQMHALGREHLSLGRMKFLYRDMKVSFLDQFDTSRHSIRNYILKVAANTLVVRTNNKKRIGDVLEVRDRHRAVFQYWVKMILSGVTTSVGAKSNRSQLKRYLKELNTRKLPPIEESLAGF